MIFYRIKQRIRRYFQPFKFAWQRVYRGYDDSALWSLDDYLAKISAPVLKRMIEDNLNHPGNISNDEWLSILEKMQCAMQLIVDDNAGAVMTKDERAEVKEGLALFGKWFEYLWT